MLGAPYGRSQGPAPSPHSPQVSVVVELTAAASVLDEVTAREVMLALSASAEVMKVTVEVEFVVLKKPATVVFRKA